MIQIQNLTVRMADKALLTDACCQIDDGARVGIVGDNGCGKSTLFRILLGQTDAFSGDVFMPKNATVAYVEQEITDTTVPILRFVLEKDTALMALRRTLETARPEELADIHDHLNRLGSDSAEGRVATILHGLGFSQCDLSRPVSDFSGGWRMRLALAGALFQHSDILLLDEPTNHLDLEATIWLENYLKKYAGTLLIISHDKDFLDHNCHAILHFEQGKLVLYSGNFHTFQTTYAARREQARRQIQKNQDKRAHLQSYIDRFRYKATKAKQAQSRLKMLEKMGQDPELLPDKQDSFEFPEADRLAPPYIRLQDAAVGYTDTPVLTHLNISIGDNERIALLGRNGNGKSTLAKLIAGLLPLSAGTLFKNTKLKVGFFNQQQNETLPADATPVAYLTPLMPDKTETGVRSYLGRFGLEANKAITPIGHLSGGEKARLVLARICISRPNLLILDEPTNHLDMTGRNALIQALNQYTGSVILITHDFHILSCVCDTLWLVQDGTCRPYKGDLDDYRTALETGPEHTEKAPATPPKIITPRPARPASKSTLTRQMQRAEQALETLTRRRDDIQATLTQGGVGIDYAALGREMTDLNTQITEQEALWDTAATALENLTAGK